MRPLFEREKIVHALDRAATVIGIRASHTATITGKICLVKYTFPVTVMVCEDVASYNEDISLGAFLIKSTVLVSLCGINA
jgi:hypothetical protein